MQSHVLKQSGGAIASQLEAAALAADVSKLKSFLDAGRGRTVLLTGAGISTDSGIPDYRGANGVYMRNKDFKPLQYQEFVKAHTYRQRYWARSFLGWPKILHAQPNASHDAVTQLQQHAVVSDILTQNVDRLHSKSGAKGVLELHGCLHEVECTNCRSVVKRQEYQEKLAEMNPKVAQWSILHPDKDSGDVASSVNPDGDVDITWNYDDFAYPPCLQCGGIMKPKVVFFGENMPVVVKNQSFEHVDKADALLVVGSSLQVFSAMRLLNRARERKIPIAIVNLGPTRGDDACDLRLDTHCTDVLATVAHDFSL
uniref:NAD-dependent protein deacetylase n=1 Tax=Globisporangium ultimum (strain ATCC 200006 / CBS 805.95 / DAOM BR144) TaxID=431595 RepID=K3WZS6_GLOUD